jgi:hypothetical protein
MALACSVLTRAATATVSTAPAPAVAVTGQFDCDGTEGGLGAYAGRVTIAPGGSVAFKNYDGIVQNGNWTYDKQTNTYFFTSSLSLATAVYKPAADSLVVVVRPGATVVHAENNQMTCQRAKPGVTGPP